MRGMAGITWRISRNSRNGWSGVEWQEFIGAGNCDRGDRDRSAVSEPWVVFYKCPGDCGAARSDSSDDLGPGDYGDEELSFHGESDGGFAGDQRPLPLLAPSDLCRVAVFYLGWRRRESDGCESLAWVHCFRDV